jgi:iron complex outermembrane receptor protein
MQRTTRFTTFALGFGLTAALTTPVLAQSGQTQDPRTTQTPAGQTPRITEPPVTVTAQKEPADPKKLPVSVTAVTKQTLDNAVIEIASDAARYSPNTFFSEFSVRKLSNPYVRGVGSSPLNPGVTTYFDGVPQLNANSSSITFLDVRQVEFVRGPQSALFGRNTLGGLVNVETSKPSLTAWTGGFAVPIGNHEAWDLNGSISGPVTDTFGVGFAMGYGEREGFTRNTVTNNYLDFRAATSWKGQALWKPTAAWETRVIVGGERARDGDYALMDLGAARSTPYVTARNFEGRNNRDLFSTTVLARHEGPKLVVSTTTGILRWETNDTTDLDYTPFPGAQRSNDEEDLQFTQEVRIGNAGAAPIKFGSSTVKWQTGVFFFTQNYDQNAVTSLATGALDPIGGTFPPFPVAWTSPQAALDDNGIGVYGQGTVTFNRLDLTAGVRLDRENKSAETTTGFEPAIAGPLTVTSEQDFTAVSPQFGAAFHVNPNTTTFVSASRGFKAGGFNPVAPAGNGTYAEERTWNVEGGVKSSFADGRASVAATVFFIDWNDLQLNQPIIAPGLALYGQFFIANVGSASSQGIEIEVTGRPHQNVEVFGSLGTTRAKFGSGSFVLGVAVEDNTLPNTPQVTGSFGTQISRPIGQLTAYGRAEIAFFGEMHYDAANTPGASQDTYALADFRAGVRHRHTFVEAWIKNAFDTRYIPLALPYQSASGFIGENGRPRTFGVRAGVSF